MVLMNAVSEFPPQGEVPEEKPFFEFGAFGPRLNRGIRFGAFGPSVVDLEREKQLAALTDPPSSPPRATEEPAGPPASQIVSRETQLDALGATNRPRPSGSIRFQRAGQPWMEYNPEGETREARLNNPVEHTPEPAVSEMVPFDKVADMPPMQRPVSYMQGLEEEARKSLLQQMIADPFAEQRMQARGPLDAILMKEGFERDRRAVMQQEIDQHQKDFEDGMRALNASGLPEEQRALKESQLLERRSEIMRRVMAKYGVRDVNDIFGGG